MLSDIGKSVRRHDPDRFLTALFAPAERREALLLLYAFNHELARAREVASQPVLALIRLQWWREVVEGAQRRHEVAEPLGAALRAGTLMSSDLLEMISARELEAEAEIATLNAWLDYLRMGAGALAVAAGRILGESGSDMAVLRNIGAAYGVAGIIRNQVIMARQGRCLLPADRLADAGLSIEAAIADPLCPAMNPVRAGLVEIGLSLLPTGPARRLSRPIIAAGLPGVLARHDLKYARSYAGQPSRGRSLLDQLAVVLSAWRGII
jgi:phytoene synthase